MHQPSTRHAELGPDFFDPVRAADFPKLTLRYRNQRWAERVGLDQLTNEEWLAHFGRFEPLPGSFPQPLALRYHGHQFRSYNPDLGDGRGFLYAQLHDLKDHRLLDFGTKGSGRTPWSRGGDGKLTLKGGVREVLATAMLEALGVYTSKSFSLIETGEQLHRGDEPSPTRGSVLVRLSHSHVRIGSFQRLSYLKEQDNIERLRDYTLETYFPELWTDDPSARTVALMGRVAENCARLAAQWIAAGFVHGVLNTDNLNMTGESFDYGPWRFLPRYDPDFTAAYFDESGLYAFGRQPDAVAWNLTRLAECLLPLTELEPLEAALNTYWPSFRRQLSVAMLARLGLQSADEDKDAALVTAIFTFLGDSPVGYEQFFFDWRGGALSLERAAKGPAAAHYATDAFRPILDMFENFVPAANVNLDHPYFARQTPRTMLIDEMEALWAPIAEDDDWSAFHAALDEIEVMRNAYKEESFEQTR